MLPEPFKSNISIVVRILPLPFIYGDRCRRKICKRMLRSFLFWNTIIIIFLFLDFLLCRSFFWLRCRCLLLLLSGFLVFFGGRYYQNNSRREIRVY
jgi:hypothetical protein